MKPPLQTCSIAEQAELHAASGLRLMPIDNHGTDACEVSIDLPVACCPVSKNPREGSAVRLSFVPDPLRPQTLETYTAKRVLSSFVNGYPGSKCGTYPPERNMEGMVALFCRMAGDALGVAVCAHATLVLDTGGMELVFKYTPSAGGGAVGE
jgi:hypothetical protein